MSTPSNKRPSRLRDSLTELEVSQVSLPDHQNINNIFSLKYQLQDLLAHNVIAHVGWSVTDYGLGLIVFSNGSIVHITVDLHLTDVIDILIDKSLEGKLLADIVGGESAICSTK